MSHMAARLNRCIHFGRIWQRTGVLVSSASGPSLTTAGFQVLLALASGHSHGYAVMTFVDQLSGGRIRLGPGTLYRTLARLVVDELVSESGANDPRARMMPVGATTS